MISKNVALSTLEYSEFVSTIILICIFCLSSTELPIIQLLLVVYNPMVWVVSGMEHWDNRQLTVRVRGKVQKDHFMRDDVDVNVKMVCELLCHHSHSSESVCYHLSFLSNDVTHLARLSCTYNCCIWYKINSVNRSIIMPHTYIILMQTYRNTHTPSTLVCC